MKQIKTAISLFFALMVVVAVIYPLLVTSVSKILFPWHANGSLIHDAEGKVIGSILIGQPFSDPKYFWSRPSATAEFPYNPLASGGSQLGPTNAELIKQISARVESLQSSGIQGQIPSDLVMASGSGLDPDISLEAALAQIPRIAQTRGLDEEKIRELVFTSLEGRLLGFLGEKHINVLKLNLALDGVEVNAHGR